MERMIDMFGAPKHIVERLKAEYPAGTRVELVRMEDEYSRLKPGDTVTVAISLYDLTRGRITYRK